MAHHQRETVRVETTVHLADILVLLAGIRGLLVDTPVQLVVGIQGLLVDTPAQLGDTLVQLADSLAHPEDILVQLEENLVQLQDTLVQLEDTLAQVEDTRIQMVDSGLQKLHLERLDLRNLRNRVELKELDCIQTLHGLWHCPVQVQELCHNSAFWSACFCFHAAGVPFHPPWVVKLHPT